MIAGPGWAADRVRAAEPCPHPDNRARAVVIVQKPGRDMALCQSCKRGFERILAAWASRTITPAEVVAQVRGMGYSRRDACLFLLGLVADRLGVRLGFSRAA